MVNYYIGDTIDTKYHVYSIDKHDRGEDLEVRYMLFVNGQFDWYQIKMVKQKYYYKWVREDEFNR